MRTRGWAERFTRSRSFVCEMARAAHPARGPPLARGAVGGAEPTREGAEKHRVDLGRAVDLECLATGGGGDLLQRGDVTLAAQHQHDDLHPPFGVVELAQLVREGGGGNVPWRVVHPGGDDQYGVGVAALVGGGHLLVASEDRAV